MKIIEHNYPLKGNLAKRAITTEIILHCSATADGKNYDVETIDGWHKDKGWTCIGYHFIIYRDGSIHRGRPVWSSGAHTTNHNGKAIGICYIGGCKKDGLTPLDTRTDAQKQAMYELVEWLLDNYHLTLTDVHGHYEFANKACPSFKITDFRNEYGDWKLAKDLKELRDVAEKQNEDDASKKAKEYAEKLSQQPKVDNAFKSFFKRWL